MLMSVDPSCRKLLTIALLVTATLAPAQRQAPEAELKAVILVNMLLFVDGLPQGKQAADRLTLCYLDAAPVSIALGQLDGKLLKGKPLQVIRVDAAATGGCHALYVSPFDGASLPQLVSGLRTGGTLLMGDSPGYLQRGVMINLEIEGERVVFDIGLRSLRQAGLAMSSKALRLARLVLE